jgi:anti-anti-sigma factor
MKEQDKTLLYRRIYRLDRRNFKPAQISTALDLPVGTVIKVLKHLKQQNGEIPEDTIAVPDKLNEPFSILTSDRKTYLILDIGGDLIAKNLVPFREELQKALKSDDVRPVALRLSDVENADSTAIGAIANFNKSMIEKNRRMVFLDPSEKIDRLFKQLNMYSAIPVFGTEMAVEKALTSSGDDKVKRGRFLKF